MAQSSRPRSRSQLFRKIRMVMVLRIQVAYIRMLFKRVQLGTMQGQGINEAEPIREL